jgi:hypothetical protein
MDRSTVFTKTAKGITQVNQKSASLSKDLMKVLKVIDGKSNLGQIMEKVEMDKGPTEIAINKLVKDGFARIFETRKEEADPFASEAAAEDDFDFTAPGKMAPGATQRVMAAAANDISELVRQQKAAEADKKQKQDAHEAARVKAKAEAEARARAEADARAKAEAEQRAMEQARRAKEAADKAKADLDAKMREEEARQKALAEARAKLLAQQKAKEEEEAKRFAEMRAKAQQEANERAKAELEAKLREEEAKRKALVEAQAKAAAEQKAKEEEEGRALADLRAKAEREAKALAEARAKAEAEAQALAKARVEAEAAARRKAEEAVSAEKEMKARLKDEIESRIRREMEELLRSELEEKQETSREEMRAEILAEARLAAKAELEERLREERETLAAAESEARVKAERDARSRAESEAKLRAEAEARAATEAKARAEAEEDLRRVRRMEARAREEAEAKTREQQEIAKRLEAERRAKIEAEARAQVEAEEAERRERELQETIDSERRAKTEAEMRAKVEAKARETVEADTRARVQAELESDMTKRAELEGKAQARAYMEAKAQAELDEEEKMRADQERKAKEIAEILRTKADAEEEAPEAPVKKVHRRRRSVVKPLLAAVVVALILGILLLHVVPLRGYATKIERTMSGWLQDDVAITTLKFTMIPTPHLKFENLSVGKQLDAKAATGRIYMDLASLFGERPTIQRIEMDNVSLSAEAVKRILTWGKAEGKTGEIDQIKLRGVKLDVRPPLEPFEATLDFARGGALGTARLSGPGGWSLNVKPAEGGTELDFNARNWTLPIGVPLQVGSVQMKGTLSGNQIVVPEFEAFAMEGKVNGSLRASWGNSVRLESELTLNKLHADQLIGTFTKNIAITGKLDGTFNVVAEAPDAEGLLKAPGVKGKFKLSEGTLSNVDLVAVMQSDAAGQRAGVTKFNEITGEYGAAAQRSTFRQVNLQGGVLRGNGSFDVGDNGSLAGRASLEIRSQVAQDRGAFAVSGTVSRPIIKRGG